MADVAFVIIGYNPTLLQTYDVEGNFLRVKSVSGSFNYSNTYLAMDVDRNIYFCWGSGLAKYNESMIQTLATASPTVYFCGICVGADGYVYTLDMLVAGYVINKRNVSDLSVEETLPVTTSALVTYSGGLAMDSDGNFYIFRDPRLEKRASDGSLTETLIVGAANNENGGICWIDGYVYIAEATNSLYKIKDDLSSAEMVSLDYSIAYAMTATSTKIIFTGWNADNDPVNAMYNTEFNEEWISAIEIGDYGYKIGSYGFTVATVTYDYPIYPVIFPLR